MQAASARVSPAAMGRIATVDERFQSYNVEMVEVVGGRFWKPYASGAVAPQPPAPRANAGEAGPVGLDPNLFEQRTAIDSTAASHAGHRARPCLRPCERHVGQLDLFPRPRRRTTSRGSEGYQSVLTRHAWAASSSSRTR